ncbi:phytase [Paenibacillus antarcticus]|uniref:3-phytase n=1 Tax=Paenibacillus antarcticus TaxID=253703 RepID=A0A162M8T7_9BACL|nr:phytase [Paenibacillus antarcticus]OAB40233.1 3-phytase [Paenibacillus antarcticus]
MNTKNTALTLLLSVGILLPTSTTLASGTMTSGYEPLRSQMDKINASITWDSDDQSALIKLQNGLSATLTVGEKSYRLAGKSGELSNAVKLVDGKMQIPSNLLQNILDENTKFLDPNNIVPTFAVTAQVETDAVEDGEDAADDPAIWVDPVNAANSKLIATNKGGGMLVYDLKGKELQNHKIGKMNNVDIRYNFPLGNKKVDIVAATNRSTNTIDVLVINGSTGELKDVVAKPIKAKMEEVYGFSLYHSLKTNKFYAMVLGKEGEFEQYEIYDNGKGEIEGKLVREFKLPTQSEGLVTDDEYGVMYIAEEDYAIYKFSAEADGGMKALSTVDIADGRRLQDDIEGLTLYYANDGHGYLIASSQGNDSYAIYDREGDNNYITNFTIADGIHTDGTSVTDGIDVLSFGLGEQFPYGIFVAQDDSNMKGDKELNQNFKIVSWELIAKGAQTPLYMDNNVNPRNLVLRSTK